MSSTKVSLGSRVAFNRAPAGSIEVHYGHQFVVQEDGTLVCDMDDVFVAGEVATGRVMLCDTPKAVDKPKGKKTLETSPPAFILDPDA